MPGMRERGHGFIDWMADVMVIVVPIIGIAIILLIFGVSIAQGVKSVAQTRTTDVQLAQAVADLATIEAAYSTATLTGQHTVTETRRALGNLAELRTTLAGKTPPLHMLAIHEQLRFTAERCEDFAKPMSQTSPEDRENPFGAIILINMREFCATQLNAARLMIAEAGMERGINPFR